MVFKDCLIHQESGGKYYLSKHQFKITIITLSKSENRQYNESKNQVPNSKDEQETHERPEREGLPSGVHALAHIVAVLIRIVLHNTGTVQKALTLGGCFRDESFFGATPLEYAVRHGFGERGHSP